MQKIKFDFEATKERIYAPNSNVPIGAPVDRNGNIANDGNAYGIVLCKETENEKYWVKYNLVVMVAGYCDIIDAQAIWGDEYSAEAIAAMSDIVFCDNHKIGGGGGGGMMVVHFTVDTETFLATPDCEISEIDDALSGGMVVIAFCEITGATPLMWTNAGIDGFISSTYMTDTHELATYKIYEEYDEDDNVYFVYAEDFVTLNVVDNS